MHRNYEQADESTLPEPVQKCIQLMKSEHMFLLLSNFSGLKLHEQAPSDTSDDDDDDSEEVDDREEEGEDRDRRQEGKETGERKKPATHGKEGKA